MHKTMLNGTVVATMALLAAIICSSAVLAADDVRGRFSWKLKGEYWAHGSRL